MIPIHQSKIFVNNYLSRDVTSFYVSECEGKEKCFLSGSNGMLGDPCGGVHKYTRILFQCIPKGKLHYVALNTPLKISIENHTEMPLINRF